MYYRETAFYREKESKDCLQVYSQRNGRIICCEFICGWFELIETGSSAAKIGEHSVPLITATTDGLKFY